MKSIKKVLFIILTIIVFNICYDVIASAWDWLYIDAFFIAYWLLIPLASVLLMIIIKFWLFKDQSTWMLFIAFLINLMVMIPYGYYLQMLPEPYDLYINIVLYLIVISTVSAAVQSLLFALVYSIVKKKLKNTSEENCKKMISKQKKWPVFIGIAVIIFHLCFFTVIFLAAIGVISGADAYWIFFPVVPIIIMALIWRKYFRHSNPWIFFLGFIVNFILWLSGALIRYLLESNFLSSSYGQVAIISTLSALALSFVFSLIFWAVGEKKIRNKSEQDKS